jgi:hypothetical protein
MAPQYPLNPPQLSCVDLRNCHQLTDASVITLAERCPLLTNVIFFHCDQPTGASVVVLAERCPLLAEVDSDRGWR